VVRSWAACGRLLFLLGRTAAFPCSGVGLPWLAPSQTPVDRSYHTAVSARVVGTARQARPLAQNPDLHSSIPHGDFERYRLISPTVSYNLVVRSVPHSRQPLSRVLGLRPPAISAGLRRAIYSIGLAVPCALIATAISDSGSVSDFVRYAVSPGLALAVRVVHVEPSHRGLGAFLDALSQYASVMSFAFWVDALLYSLFIFGAMTTISALTQGRPER